MPFNDLMNLNRLTCCIIMRYFIQRYGFDRINGQFNRCELARRLTYPAFL
jgi:hypothetical protein